MAYTTIDDPSAFFQVATYSGANTGSGSSMTVTNDGNSNLQPDLVWFKRRSAVSDTTYVDSTRGVNKFLYSGTYGTSAEETQVGVGSFDSDGITLTGYQTYINADGSTYVAWQWKVNGGTTASNTDGDLTSTVQVNQTAGISIFTYTGKDPIEPLDIGHGLGSAPDMFIIKRRNGGSRNWGVYHKDMDATPQNGYLRLNTTGAYAAASTWWRNEAPTSTIIKTGEQADVNQPNDTFVGYAFKGIQGYSKFGKYSGNYQTSTPYNGPFVYCGFQPAFVMIKRVDSANDWIVFDHKRDEDQGGNVINPYIEVNTSIAETNNFYTGVDMLSNGFKVRGYDGNANAYGTYIYMAFAKHPFVSSGGVPCTAR
jgi:hypothetical protein